jgi:hypothetical protein
MPLSEPKFNEIDSRRNNVQTINEEDSDNNDAMYFQYLAQLLSMEIATKTINTEYDNLAVCLRER